MWARLGVKHLGTGEPSIGVRDILMFSMLISSSFSSSSSSSNLAEGVTIIFSFRIVEEARKFFVPRARHFMIVSVTCLFLKPNGSTVELPTRNHDHAGGMLGELGHGSCSEGVLTMSEVVIACFEWGFILLSKGVALTKRLAIQIGAFGALCAAILSSGVMMNFYCSKKLNRGQYKTK